MIEIEAPFETDSLGNLATVRRGITYSASMLVDRNDGIPYINMKSFEKGGGFNSAGLKYFGGYFVTDDMVRENDLLVVNTDVTPGGDIVGTAAALPQDLRNGPVVFSHHVTRLRLDERVSTDYLYYLLNINNYRKLMLKYARGTTVLMLDMSGIKKIPIRYHRNAKVQQKVVSILQIIDQTIEKTEALIEKYQQIKAGLMHDLFTRGIGPDGKLRPPHEQAPELYQKTPIGWIPKEWQLDVLDNQIRIIDCKHITPSYCEEGYPIIRPRNIHDDGLDFENVDYVSHKDYLSLTDIHAPRLGDIVYSRNASFGIPCYVDTDIKFSIGQDVVVMTEKAMDTRFAYYLLKSSIVWQQILRLFAGSTFSRINLGDIRKYVVPNPTKEEQGAISERLQTIDNRIDKEVSNRKKLQRLKAGLMHDILTGKVQVNIEHPEVANV